MHMQRALRGAGGTGGIQPEAHVVARGRRRLEAGRGFRRQCLQMQAAARVLARHDDVPEKRQVFQDRLERRQQRLGHHQRSCAAVLKHEPVVRRRQQRVRGNRHDARLDATEEHGRKIDRVQMRQHHPTFHFQAKTGERVRRAVHALGEFAIAVTPGVIDVGNLVRTAGNEIALDQIERRVVVARYPDIRRTDGLVHLADCWHAHSPMCL